MNAEGKGSLGYRVAKRILFAIFLLFLSIVLLGIGGSLAFIIELPVHFFLGWAFHAWKALPHLFGKWQEAVLPLGCLLMAAVLAHRFARRWVGEKFPDRTWRIRHTAAVLSLLLLGSAAAIAASGVVHQMFWLGRGEILENRGMRVERTIATSNARQIMLYLFEFQVGNGRYPHSLSEVDMPADLEWFQPKGWRVPEPFVLLRPGSTEIASEREPLIVSPLLDGGETYVIGYGDTSARSIRARDFMKVIGKYDTRESEGGR